MINHSDIEAELGITTLLTDRMEQAIRDWYDAAIDGKPLNKDADTLSMGWPEAICGELSRLTTLELEATVAGSERADWINTHLQRVLSPRHKKILSVALALGSGIWKPYQSGEDIGVAFIPATGYYPVSLNAHGELTEAVFVDQIEDSKNFYNRLEWMHVLHSPEDYHQKESEIVDKLGRGYAPVYPCVQVISLAYQSSTKDALGAPIDLSARDEWADIEPIAFMPELEKLPVGYFTTPITNTVDVNSDIGAAIFAPAKRQIIDADVQYTRLDWEYEGGELAVDVDEQYLKPTQEGTYIDAVKAKLHFGVPSTALTDTPAHHRDRLFHGIDVNTGIANAQPFYQVYSPSLRDTNYLSGLNAYIRNIESHVGLSYGTFSQVSEVEKDSHRDHEQPAKIVLPRFRYSSEPGSGSAGLDLGAGLLGRPA
jgi:hypothetical protein